MEEAENKTQNLKETGTKSPEGTKPLSKNKIRKERNYLRRIETRKLKREKDRASKRKRNKNRNVTEKDDISNRLLLGQQSGPKVVIDCRYESRMSLKEQKRLAQQLKRVYSSNRASESPLHLYFTSLAETTELYKLCCQLNDGFDKYIVERTCKSVAELFMKSDFGESGESDKSKLIYLSPDSPNVLETFDPDVIYVVGGLVDETVSNNISYQLTQQEGIASARLPIDKYFTRDDKGTFKKVLTVNQVFDIILEYYRTKDWVSAIQAGLPKRTGFVPVESSSTYIVNSTNAST